MISFYCKNCSKCQFSFIEYKSLSTAIRLCNLIIIENESIRQCVCKTINNVFVAIYLKMYAKNL